MKKEVQVIEKPAEISWDSIHEILLAAHSDKNKVGGAQTSAYLSGDELEKEVGNGKCFIALVDNKIVGTASVNIRERNFWYHKGMIAYYCFDAVIPDCQGLGIYSKLDAARDEFVKMSGVNVIYIHTSYSNKKMQEIKRKQGYRLVGFHAFKDTNYYSVTLAKWLDGCPFPKCYCALRYYYYMVRMKLRYRDRH